MERLKDLTRDLKTLDDVLNAFGSPDLDNPAGYGATKDDCTGRPVTTYYRQLNIQGPVRHRHVNAVVGLDNQVQFSFMAKGITGT